MGIGNALPANPAVLRGVNIVTFLMARAKQLGFNTFRCVHAPGIGPCSCSTRYRCTIVTQEYLF